MEAMRITIVPKDLYLLPDYRDLSIRTLRRRYNSIRDFVGKEKPQPLTYTDLATFFCLPEDQIRELMTASVRSVGEGTHPGKRKM